MHESRSGIDYIGQYRCSSRAKQALRSLGLHTTVVVDWYLFNKFRAMGVELVPERDNKSVWSPEWLEKGLGRYGSYVPESLRSRVEALSSGSAAESGKRLSATVGSQRSGNGETERKARPAREKSGNSLRAVSSKGDAAGVHLLVDRPEHHHRGEVVPSGETGNQRGVRGPGFDPELYERAKAAALSSAGGGARRRAPYSMDDVVDHFVHRSHFAGAPYFCTNAEALDRAVRDASNIASGQRGFDPYVAGRRVQHGPRGPKGRLVWMAPLSTTLLATRFAKAAYQGLAGARPFAYTFVKHEVGGIISEFQSRFKRTVALDFSAFDASLSSRLIDDAFGILKTHVDLSDPAEARLWDRLVNEFIHSRIVLPDQSIWQVHRGVPSGSAFTSLIDSVCNLIIINYVWLKVLGYAPDPDGIMILGDDSIVGTNHWIDIRDVERAAVDLGIVVSTDKSEVAKPSDSVPFLGHRWVNGRPHRSFEELYVRLAFPERHKKRTKADSIVRAYSFLADCEEMDDVFFNLWKHHSRDQQQKVRDVLARAGDRPSIDWDSGPGYLRYLAKVEKDPEVQKLSLGTRLWAIGRLY